jgi:hypothetical protein
VRHFQKVTVRLTTRWSCDIAPAIEKGGLKILSKSEEREWDPGGERVIRQLDKIWTKYTGKPAPNALRDPAIDEKRVLVICEVDRIATFGKP